MSFATPRRTPSRRAALSARRRLSSAPRPSKAKPKIPTGRRGLKGQLLSCGSGDICQLGHGEDDDVLEVRRFKLIEALKDEDVLEIVSGALHNAALTRVGKNRTKLWTWGCSDEGQLGHSGEGWLPEVVDGLEDVTIAQVACGATHTLALDKDGIVYGCGLYRDLAGPVGFSETEKIRKQLRPIDGLKDIVQIAAGEQHDLALSATGEVFQWGDIGVGLRQSRRRKATKLIPRRVRFRSGIRIEKVWAGGYGSFARDQDGDIWAWGPNNYNQLGLPNPEKPSDEGNEQGGELIAITVPEKVPFDKPIAEVACDTHHGYALSRDGTVYSFGRGDMGRLGHGDEKDHETPTPIKVFEDLPKDNRVVWIGSGECHGLAVTAQGHLYTWGYGDLLQLGNGEEEDLLTPTLIQSKQVRERKVVKAVGGCQHSIILAYDDPPPPPMDQDGEERKVGKKRRAEETRGADGNDGMEDDSEDGNEFAEPVSKRQRQSGGTAPPPASPGQLRFAVLRDCYDGY